MWLDISPLYKSAGMQVCLCVIIVVTSRCCRPLSPGVGSGNTRLRLTRGTQCWRRSSCDWYTRAKHTAHTTAKPPQHWCFDHHHHIDTITEATTAVNLPSILQNLWRQNRSVVKFKGLYAVTVILKHKVSTTAMGGPPGMWENINGDTMGRP